MNQPTPLQLLSQLAINYYDKHHKHHDSSGLANQETNNKGINRSPMDTFSKHLINGRNNRE